jgi:hypothetical protein
VSERDALPVNFSARIFRDLTESAFSEIAVELFRENVEHNRIYADFVRHLGCDPESVGHFSEIPCLPVSFFKTQRLIWEGHSPRMMFLSSGTAGTERSRHYVASPDLYRDSLLAGFRYFLGDPAGFYILALMPSPAEAPESSLVFMMQELIKASAGGQFLIMGSQSGRGSRKAAGELGSPSGSEEKTRNPQDDPGVVLREYLNLARKGGRKTLLVGITYALLDLAANSTIRDASLLVAETGGMKGRRKELVRAEVHENLKAGFGVDRVFSEYGMSELLSQAWSLGEGHFRCPPWMRVLVRDPNDPLSYVGPGQTGGISVIDLANRYSCPFIATQDLGRIHKDGSFEVMGRFDDSDIRGCSLLA